jgi:hypothetical protein
MMSIDDDNNMLADVELNNLFTVNDYSSCEIENVRKQLYHDFYEKPSKSLVKLSLKRKCGIVNTKDVIDFYLKKIKPCDDFNESLSYIETDDEFDTNETNANKNQKENLSELSKSSDSIKTNIQTVSCNKSDTQVTSGKESMPGFVDQIVNNSISLVKKLDKSTDVIILYLEYSKSFIYIFN